MFFVIGKYNISMNQEHFCSPENFNFFRGAKF